mmetsp:Transcript_55331/g.139865  ORF Transcript_55331/g.139865 Transcript_55331/m.139865 type:complete len:202 (-) Transcript_55331:90-695(-)
MWRPLARVSPGRHLRGCRHRQSLQDGPRSRWTSPSPQHPRSEATGSRRRPPATLWHRCQNLCDRLRVQAPPASCAIFGRTAEADRGRGSRHQQQAPLQVPRAVVAAAVAAAVVAAPAAALTEVLTVGAGAWSTAAAVAAGEAATTAAASASLDAAAKVVAVGFAAAASTALLPTEAAPLAADAVAEAGLTPWPGLRSWAQR